MDRLQYEFCPKCGHQVFAKEGQPEIKSKWDCLLWCEVCKEAMKLEKTVSLIEQYCEGTRIVRLRYLHLPALPQSERGDK